MTCRDPQDGDDLDGEDRFERTAGAARGLLERAGNLEGVSDGRVVVLAVDRVTRMSTIG
jgi:hypothetical protein